MAISMRCFMRSAFTHPTYLSVHLRPICIKRVYVSTFYAILQAGPKKHKIYSRTYRYLLNELKRPTVRGANNRVRRFLFRISFGFGESREQSIFIYFSSFRREIGFWFLRSLRKFVTTIREKILTGLLIIKIYSFLPSSSLFFFFFELNRGELLVLFASSPTLHRKITRSLECTYEFLKYPSSKRLHSQVSRKSRC